MNKFKGNFRWIIVLTALIMLVVGSIWITVYAILPPDIEEVEECFQEDKVDLAFVVEYLRGADYEYISINKSELEEGLIFTGAGTRYQKIENASVIEVLDRLLSWGGYNRITKSNQTIIFEKWDWFEMDRGIAYPLCEENQPVVEFLIKAEPLSESGWYYYEADYEEYRNLHELW